MNGSETRESHAGVAGKRVLILNWRDEHHPEAGGSEVYVGQMARGLMEHGAEVTMLCPRYPGSARREVVDGVRYLRMGGRLTIYLLVPLLALLRLLPRHDLILEIQNGVPFCAAAYSRRPVVVLVHHVHREQWPILFHPATAGFGWWLESRLAPRVARTSPYVTVSRSTARELVELGVDAERIQVVHNGSPDHGDFESAPRDAAPTLMVLGRLVPHKRVELAVQALNDLKDEFPDLSLIVAGEGWWHSHLVDMVRDLGLQDRVEFTGHVSEQEKGRLLARAWVLAMPSVKEGWGLVVVEAGLHQTPAVAFASAGGVTESILHEETGLLVDDEAGFTRAVGELLRDPALRDEYGQAAEKHARSFTWERSQEAFAEYLGAHIS